jgi:lambda family phage portal protein
LAGSTFKFAKKVKLKPEMKLPFIDKLLGRSPVKRSLEAASTGRRWPDERRGRVSPQLNTAVLNARAESFALNNAHGTRIVQVATQNIIGTGIIPRSQTTNKPIKDRLRKEWQAFTDNSDFEEVSDFYGQQSNAVRDLVVFGEALFSLERASNGQPQLLRLHPDQLDRSKNIPLSDGGYIIQGVEFDARGKRKAYWICPKPVGNVFAGISLAPQRRPANTIIHMFRPLVPGQVRGLSWFAPILLTAYELDQLLDALLVRAKVGAMYVGSITDVDGNGPGLDGDRTGNNLDTSIEPGTVRVEAPGKELRWNEPPSSGDAPALATETLRMMAVGAGITYEQLTGDYSKVNYSSSRSAQLEFRRFAETIQHHTVVFQFCRPIWRDFVLWQVLKGTISGSSYVADTAAATSVKWLPPAWQWVDPLKDTNAAVIAIKNNLRSRSDVVAEQGYDIEDVDAEIASDQQRQKNLKFELQTGGANAA